MVSGSLDKRTGKWWFGLASDEVKIAMEAAHQMADRFQKPMAIQSDLSVVPADETTQEVLEIVRP
jgi:hypothetical protein|tara:strand:- start:1765 stop:1959 length:195 start_codon:yes stop_codon:yes gene_type:complete